jgi:hypothetical protein
MIVPISWDSAVRHDVTGWRCSRNWGLDEYGRGFAYLEMFFTEFKKLSQSNTRWSRSVASLALAGKDGIWTSFMTRYVSVWISRES